MGDAHQDTSANTHATQALSIPIAVFGAVFGGCALYTLGIVATHTAITQLAPALALAAGIGGLVAWVRHRAYKGRSSSFPHNGGRAAKPHSWFRLYLVLQALSLPCMIAFALTYAGTTNTDYADLFDIATAYLQGADIPHLQKYGAYPNNHLLLMCMIMLFQAVSTLAPTSGPDTLLACNIVVNVLLIQGAMLFTALASRHLWGNTAGAATGTAMLAFAPLWLSSFNPYSDTSTIFFIALALLFAARFLKAGENAAGQNQGNAGRQLLFIALAAASLGIGFKLKATAAIVLVALAIAVLFLQRPRPAAKTLAVTLAAALLAIGACNVFVEAVRPAELPYDDAIRAEQAFPYTHWPMMALNLNSDGSYVKKDYVRTLRISGDDAKRERIQAITAYRLEHLGTAGLAYRIGYQKPMVLWKWGALVRDDEYAMFMQAGGAKGAAYHACLLYAQTYQLVLLAGISFAGFALMRRHAEVATALLALRNGRHTSNASRYALLLIAMLALFGFLAFLCGIWEVKARYLIHFSPLLVLIATGGWLNPTCEASCEATDATAGKTRRTPFPARARIH